MAHDDDDDEPQRSQNSYGSHETGGSSASGGLIHDASPEAARRISHAVGDDTVTRRRSHRPRPSGGFLLSNPILDDPASRSTETARDNGRRRSRIPVDIRKGKSPMRNTPSPSAFATPELGIDARDVDETVGLSGGRRVGSNERPASSSKIPSPRPNSAMAPRPSSATSLDVDSTQIVNMALNLNESRRIAQRKSMSSPVPPRLAPLPDSSTGGSLKQHLQQQRRTSRNISPNPRNVSFTNSKINSPLQASFDHEGSYTYHFSPSTLNRAEKARQQLELMAQYRRILNFLPPLKPDAQIASRPSTSSPPTSPTNASTPQSSSSSNHQTAQGRSYNPLQYIRNRKVRARERKTIDGETQGFSDANKVADWVHQAEISATTAALPPGSSPIPPFPSAHAATAQQNLSPSNIPVPVSSVSKPKRPRLDWALDPADMLADVYWLEQGDNKSLIEDRHYARIFPNKSSISSRPMSPQSDSHGMNAVASVPVVQKEPENNDASAEARNSDSNAASKAETEASHISTRDRARQKLHELRGIHHNHNSSVHSHHDFLHLRKGSFSDTSDSEADRRVRGRLGTVSANGKAVLEKQMNEMLAKEARDEQKENLDHVDVGLVKPSLPPMVTPDRSTAAHAHSHSRKGSRMENGDFMERIGRGQTRHGSPGRSGRASLEVPGYRPSLDLDSSLPPSPDLKPFRNSSQFMPSIGMDLSPPSSRPSSPVRNPFSKVKSIFRDRSRERSRERERLNEHVANEDGEKPGSPTEELAQLNLSPVSAGSIGSPERQRSRSPIRKIIPRTTGESHKSHRSMGSTKLGKDDQIGLRSIFKGGAKIDGIIRGGVSKMSDLLWKKDMEGDAMSSTTSSDESDVEQSRGRHRTPGVLSRSNSKKRHENHQEKHYLEVMPSFKSASELEKLTLQETDSVRVLIEPPPLPPSSRSPRFDRLKPPRLDVRSAHSSPVSSPIEPPKTRAVREAEMSEVDSRSRDSGKSNDRTRKTSNQPNNILSLPSPTSRPHGNSVTKTRPRHWSISDRSPSPNIAGNRADLSRREVARIRALVLSSGIKAMEISRRANEPHPIFALDNASVGLPWTDMSRFAPPEQAGLSVPQTELYPTTAKILAASVEKASARLEKQTQIFAADDMRCLHAKVNNLHGRVAAELMEMTRRAADEADECSRDLVDGQRLKVKMVVDMIEKMLRRRRRRFRWVRRAGWLAVEWVLVGFMWYVWFLVMIARIFLGIGRAFVGVGRWLLWL